MLIALIFDIVASPGRPLSSCSNDAPWVKSGHNLEHRNKKENTKIPLL